jgi:hypothetical protein
MTVRNEGDGRVLEDVEHVPTAAKNPCPEWPGSSGGENRSTRWMKNMKYHVREGFVKW